MKPEDELRHLLYSAYPGEEIEYPGLCIYVAECPGNAEQVLQNCRDVLSVVLRQYEKPWPCDREWLQLLPKWFIERCAPERTDEEVEQDQERFRQLSPEEQAKEIDNEEWSVLEWIYWFDLSDDIRYWFWWGAIIEDCDTLLVAIKIVDWPIPYESFLWLLRASGAISVDEILGDCDWDKFGTHLGGDV
ncbi:hypothetical protein [Roseofilum casamattae]|uniref:DUF4253 domain-containing protein n=1 Tax=Roseofilum casamattae BLCC-M143 TaxID=3022442 RepID=A0ABT7BUK0_9CYAN|nr:hypothetical protein [Roseofilum casamattae]MDJ1182860.1 hypothetical protein [Roseofilum casamattae BLCC-M143]